MKFTTSILTILTASVLLLQGCGSDTTTNSTELANVLDAAADREGVPSGECRDKCVAAALAMFDACTDDGGNREACFGHALLSFFDCAKQCGDPDPPACEDKCEEYAHKVYEQCLKDNVEPKNSGTGGEEQRCAALAREALAECLAEDCVDPKPKPPTCKDDCEQYAEVAFADCLMYGANEKQCAAFAEEALAECLVLAEDCVDPDPPTCDDGCKIVALAVLEECLDGGVEPKISDTGGEAERCAALAREAYAECLAEVCVDPEPTPIGCDEDRCFPGDNEHATLCKEAIAACIAFEPLNEEECILAGNFIFCDEGEPDPEPGEPPASGEVCDEGLCAEPGVPRERCEAAFVLCIENTPEANWEECVVGAPLLFCEVI